MKGRFTTSSAPEKAMTCALLATVILVASVGLACAADTWLGRTLDIAVNYHTAGVQTTADGGYLLLGTTTDPSDLSSYVRLVKFDASGAVVWVKQYISGTSHTLDKTDDGCYIVTAELPDVPAPGMTWVAKIDPDGNPIGQTYVDTRFTFAKAVGDAVYLVTETSDLFGGRAGNGIAKLDLSSFTVAWSMGFTYIAQPIRVRSLEAEPGGGLCIAGWLANGGSGLLKIAADGTLQDFRTITDPAGRNIKVRGIARNGDGGLVLAGDGDSWANPTDRYDVWAARLTSAWNFVWQRSFVKDVSVDWSNSVSVLADGSILVGASTRGWSPNGQHDVWGLRLRNSSGSVLWQKRYWTVDIEESYTQLSTPDGGALLAAEYRSSLMPGQIGSFLVKTDANGSVSAKNPAGETIQCPCVATTNVSSVNTSATITVDLASTTILAFDALAFPVDPPASPVDVTITYAKVCN